MRFIRRYGKLVSALALVGTVVLACGDSSTTSPPSSQQVVVGPAGGTVQSGAVKLVIPAGALASDVAVTIADDGSPPDGYSVSGRVYRFAPSGLRFLAPITVTMPAGHAGQAIHWSVVDDERRFERLATRLSDEGATAEISHFSSGFVGALLDDDAGADAASDAADDASDAAPDGGPAVCPAAETPLPCPGCRFDEDSFCDIGCQLAPGAPTLCFDSKSNPKHCGGCGIACATGEVCVEGHCAASSTTRLVTGIGTPEDIVLDAQNLYYADSGTNEVWQVSKATGTTTRLASGQSKPFRLAVDTTHVYWTNSTGGSIARAPIGGGAPAEIFYSATTPYGIAVDASHVYWTGNAIYKAPKNPMLGSPVVLHGGNGGGQELHIDDTRVYGWTQNCIANGPYGAFGIDKTAGSLTSYGGCQAVAMSVGVGIDDTRAYFFRSIGGGTFNLYSAKKDASDPVVRNLCDSGRGAFGCVQESYDSFAVDSCGFYWAVASSIVRLLPGDLVPRRIFKGVGAGGPRRVAVDDTYVYWTDVGFIGRVPK